jgi:TFIIF-interacting CTD phosphatase-like protein
MVTGKRGENIYEAAKRSRDDYMKSLRDHELYRDINKLKEMIKAYYDALARMRAHDEVGLIIETTKGSLEIKRPRLALW